MKVGKRTSRLARSPSLAAAPGVPALGVLVAAPTASAPSCMAATAQAVAPQGMTVGPIGTPNPDLLRVPTGAFAATPESGTPAYRSVTSTVVPHPATGETARFGLALPEARDGKFLLDGRGGYCGVVFQSPPNDRRGGGYPTGVLARGHAIAATDEATPGARACSWRRACTTATAAPGRTPPTPWARRSGGWSGARRRKRARLRSAPQDDRARPVLRTTMSFCPFPMQARHNGAGGVSAAASRSCAANQDLLQISPNGIQAGLAEAGC